MAKRRACRLESRPTAGATEMLTPAEIEALRQSTKETSAYLRKRFAHLRPGVVQTSGESRQSADLVHGDAKRLLGGG